MAVATSVDEGAPVLFNIAGNEDLRDDVVVEYTLSPEGDFFDGLRDGVQRINLSVSQQTAQVEIATIDDSFAEQDGATDINIT